MDLAALRELATDAAFAAHGVAAVVTTPYAERSIETAGIWITPGMEEFPVGEFSARERRRVMAFKVSEVCGLPKGTIVEAAEIGQSETRRWMVDGIDRRDAHTIRAVLIPLDDCC